MHSMSSMDKIEKDLREIAKRRNKLSKLNRFPLNLILKSVSYILHASTNLPVLIPCASLILTIPILAVALNIMSERTGIDPSLSLYPFTMSLKNCIFDQILGYLPRYLLVWFSVKNCWQSPR